MKTCLQKEMKIRNIDWIILSGSRASTSDIVYMLPNAGLVHPVILIKQAAEPIVIYEPMEKEEALKTGLDIYSKEDILPRAKSLALSSEKERLEIFYSNLFEKFKVKGNVLFCGNDEINNSFILHELVSSMPYINLVSDENKNIFHVARQTKENYELDILRDISFKTVKIFSEIETFLRKGILSGDHIKNETGENIKIGDIRKLVLKIMAAENLIPEQIPIIAMGKDGSSPHCRGNDSEDIITGLPIVIDISPKSVLNGYFSDMTRTVCVGKPSAQIREIYETVKSAYELSLKYITEGVRLCEPDIAVSEYFKSKNHKVVMDSPGITEGYVHSLGHGIGLDVHELPRISVYNRDDSQVFKKFMAFTIEPGLYYEDKNLGIRLENTFCINEKGELENLTEFPMNLEI